MTIRARSLALVGQRFGKQVVLRILTGAKAEVQCDCGVVKATPIQYLRNGQSRSCGCGRYDPRPATSPINIGDVFGILTVVQLLGTNGRKREVLVQCECQTRKVVDESSLRSGTIKSCGCFRRQRMAQFNHPHGQSGSRRTVLYRTWEGMRTRCSKPERYPTYIGIRVCPEWDDSFAAFRDYVDENLGPRPDGYSLDRIDNLKGYEPGNIRWSTAKRQARNRRSNVDVTIDGITHCIADWAEINGIHQSVVQTRLRNGWTLTDAVTKPADPRKRRARRR